MAFGFTLVGVSLHTTVFYERAGEDAQGAATHFAETMAEHDGFLGCRLLGSAEQPNLYLLVSEWRAGASAPEAPETFKVWRFHELGAFGPDTPKNPKASRKDAHKRSQERV